MENVFSQFLFVHESFRVELGVRLGLEQFVWRSHG